MSATLKKITDLAIDQSFMQVNLVRGYKYIDRAGEIVNSFYYKDKVPHFTMDLNGLVIERPEESAQQLKVSSNDIWVFFTEPSSLEYMDSFFVKKVEDITKILDVSEVSRAGWRHYFIHEFKDEKQRNSCFDKFAAVENSIVEDITLSARLKEISLTIRLKQVLKKKDKSFPGILIDVDLFREYSPRLTVDKLKSVYSDFKTLLRSDEFLSLMNKIISEKDNG